MNFQEGYTYNKTIEANYTNEPSVINWKYEEESINKLIREIKLPGSEYSLFETLKIPSLKEQLQEIRENPGYTANEISQEESRIANIIQDGVSKISCGGELTSSPDEMLKTNSSNCVGRSILGGAYFREVGLNYLVGDLRKHSIIFHVLSDGQVESRDMQESSSNSKKLTDDMIRGERRDGKTLNMTDIVEFSNNPHPKGLSFNLNTDYHQSYNSKHVVIYAPEVGHKLQRLNNLGISFVAQDLDEDAIEACKECIRINPDYDSAHYHLGNSLARLGRYEEAIEPYKACIRINPDHASAYNNLGISLGALGRHTTP